RLAPPGDTRRVANRLLHARPPRAAVPDDLLDPHAARQRVRVAGAVGREQQLDQAPPGTAVGRVAGVEVPVDRTPFAVQGVVAARQLLAAHDSPRLAPGVGGQPTLERDSSGPWALRAMPRAV